MIKPLRLASMLAVAVATMTFAPLHVSAADTNAVIDNVKIKKPKFLPFHGTLSAIDKTALTISVGERTFQITSDTKINKNEKPAILDDAVVGDTVGGAYKKTADGKLDAITINLTTKTDKPAKTDKTAKPEKAPGEM
jgi:hypothetical protein